MLAMGVIVESKAKIPEVQLNRELWKQALISVKKDQKDILEASSYSGKLKRKIVKF